MKKNSIIVSHFSGDGGNFLIAALTMSDKVKVGNGKIQGKKQKINYYFEKLDPDRKRWSDLTMWSGFLYNNDKHSGLRLSGLTDSSYYIYKHHYPTFIPEDLNLPKEKEPSVEQREKGIIELLNKISTKTNCFSICFKNPTIFTALRHYFFNSVSRTCNYKFEKCNSGNTYHPYIDFPMDEELNQLTIEEYQSISKERQNYFIEKYSTSYEQILSCVKNKKYHKFCDSFIDFYENRISFIWDVNWFLSEDDTANNIERLYDILEFDDYDDDLIRRMYRSWISRLSKIVELHRKLT
jgi:hypothetical protein